MIVEKFQSLIMAENYHWRIQTVHQSSDQTGTSRSTGYAVSLQHHPKLKRGRNRRYAASAENSSYQLKAVCLVAVELQRNEIFAAETNKHTLLVS